MSGIWGRERKYGWDLGCLCQITSGRGLGSGGFGVKSVGFGAFGLQNISLGFGVMIHVGFGGASVRFGVG